MGEASAKTLRGATMADVIFNGSSSRKPVGQASVELIFDNTKENSPYAEIAIRRVVSRDGQSNYYLNGTRCRRKDIADIFLGTGLGARSYAIIGQNTISQIIEAKPEELRQYIEEAAGISKYKERRKDATSRMENTRENLSRLSDIQQELNKHVQHLEKQAATANLYKQFSADAQQLQAECDAIRWQEWHTALIKQDNNIQQTQQAWETLFSTRESLQQQLTEKKQAHQTALEQQQQQQTLCHQQHLQTMQCNEHITAQTKHYKEQQTLLHQIQQEQQQQQNRMQQDTAQLSEFAEAIAILRPQRDQAQADCASAEQNLQMLEQERQSWQKNWDAFQQKAAELNQQTHITRLKVEQLTKTIAFTEQQLTALDRKKATYPDLTTIKQNLDAQRITEKQLAQQLDTHKQTRDTLTQLDKRQREQHQQLQRDVDAFKKVCQHTEGQLAALEALQAAALGKKQQDTHKNISRLAEIINVDPSWEKAVACVLETWLQASCVPALDYTTLNGTGRQIAMTSQENPPSAPPCKGREEVPRLIDKINNLPPALHHTLENIYIADDLDTAKTLQTTLPDQASVITREGVWLHHNRLQWTGDDDVQTQILHREKAIHTLRETLQTQTNTWQAQQEQLAASQKILSDNEQQRHTLAETVQTLHQQWTQCTAQINIQQHQLTQQQQQQDTHEKDYQAKKALLAQSLAEKQQLEIAHSSANTLQDTHEAARQSWQTQKTELDNRYQLQRLDAQQQRNVLHAHDVKLNHLTSQHAARQENITRENITQQTLQTRHDNTNTTLKKTQADLDILKPQLIQHQQQQHVLDAELKTITDAIATLLQDTHHLEQQRDTLENTLREKQTALEKQRLDAQTLRVKCESLETLFNELNRSLEKTLDNIPEHATLSAWEKQLRPLQAKIQQLGPINLAALDEYTTESERKQHLDTQCQDLTEALETLENVIRQIDTETRACFQDTYEKIHRAFQELFPRLFGGGQAYLSLTSNDCLDAGVMVMAQPPGKRNSSIYLLSGGEKAMTAVALVFAIFQQNPAPFCMLDEVDAPLDEANVVRFCTLVKEMSEHIQFIFITHNKVTMELATHLTGVTMNEPGVSRIVSVDVDEAVALTAAVSA